MVDRLRGEIELTADADLANHHIRNWPFLEDLPDGGATEGQILVARSSVWTPENLDVAHLPIGGTLVLSNLTINGTFLLTGSMSGVSYTELEDIPSTFTPNTHTHTRADITNFTHSHIVSEITDFSTELENTRRLTANFVIYSTTTLTTGTKAYVKMPADGEITSVEAYANATCTVQAEIYAGTYGDFPLDTGDQISASTTDPGMSSANKYRDTTLTGWSTTVTAGDIWEFVITTATTATLAGFAITMDRD